MSKRNFILKLILITILVIICFLITTNKIAEYITEENQLQSIKIYIAVLFCSAGLFTFILLFLTYIKEIKLVKVKEYLSVFSHVANKLDQSLVAFSNENKVIWINESFEKQFGYTFHELDQKSLTTLITGQLTNIDNINQNEAHIFTNKKPTENENILYNKKGQHFWFKIQLTPIFTKQGELNGYVAFLSNIDNRKRNEEKIKLNESRFNQISEVLNDVFYLYDIKNKKYELIGGQSKAVLGVDPDYFYTVNNFTQDYIHPDDQIITKNAEAQILNNESYQIEYRILKDGKTSWIFEKGFPVLNDNGEVTKTSGFCSDITEKVKRKESIIKSQNNTKLLAQIGLEIAKHIKTEDIIKATYGKINQMMKAYYFGIGIINTSKNTIDFPYFIEGDKSYTSSHSLNDNILAVICIKRKEAIIINDFENEITKYTGEKLDTTKGGTSKSIMYIPLIIDNEIIGTLTVQSKYKNAYTSHQIDLFKNISIYISQAIQHANLFKSLETKIENRTKEVVSQKEKIEKSNKNAELLSKIGTELSASLHFEDIFDKLHYNISQLMDAEIFSIRILNRKKNIVKYKFNIENGIIIPSTSISLNDKNNYTVWCIENKKTIHINDNKKDFSKYVSEIIVPFGKMPSSLIFAPIINNNEVLGVITVQSFETNTYTKHHVDILKTLAFYTGIAISNANLYESLEDKVTNRTEELTLVNKEITQSINYTKSLQEATLSSNEDMKALLPTSFILYQPRDIVSGDFYHLKKIITKDKEELVSIIVGDCTGHGIPGATLAILCSNIVRQAYQKSNIVKPSQVLDFTRDSLINLFKSDDRIIYDGMDASIGVFNLISKEFHFSGASHNCYVVRNNEVLIFKGNKTHVGFSEVIVEFTTEIIQLQKNDSVYFTTDGFYDQFGGPRFKKFGRKRFRELIVEIDSLNADEKLKVLDSTINKWKANSDQIDDICMFGFKVE